MYNFHAFKTNIQFHGAFTRITRKSTVQDNNEMAQYTRSLKEWQIQTLSKEEFDMI